MVILCRFMDLLYKNKKTESESREESFHSLLALRLCVWRFLYGYIELIGVYGGFLLTFWTK